MDDSNKKNNKKTKEIKIIPNYDKSIYNPENYPKNCSPPSPPYLKIPDTIIKCDVNGDFSFFKKEVLE